MKKATLLELKLLIHCFTFARMMNLIVLAVSRWLSVFSGRACLWGVPFAVTVEPTSCCNLHCVECPSGNGSLLRPHGFMSMDLFREIIDKVSKRSFYLNLYFQGEPTMHPDFSEMVAYAKSKRMFVFSSTNGHFLTEKTIRQMVDAKLDKLIVSMDGHDQESYSQYRVGGSFVKVMQGVENITRLKVEKRSKIPLVVAQVLLLKTTENHLEEINALAIGAGVDKVELKKTQFYNPNGEDALLPQNPKHLRYAFSETQGWILKNQKKRGCKRLWNTMVVTWDGKVLPCCYDKDADYAFGEMQDQAAPVILNNPKARAFRASVLKGRSNYPICRNCGE